MELGVGGGITVTCSRLLFKLLQALENIKLFSSKLSQSYEILIIHFPIALQMVQS